MHGRLIFAPAYPLVRAKWELCRRSRARLYPSRDAGAAAAWDGVLPCAVGGESGAMHNCPPDMGKCLGRALRGACNALGKGIIAADGLMGGPVAGGIRQAADADRQAVNKACAVWKVVRVLGVMVEICILPDKCLAQGSGPAAGSDSISTPLAVFLGCASGITWACMRVILRGTPSRLVGLRPYPLREPSCAGMPGRAFPCPPSPGICAPGGGCTAP